MNKWVKRKWLRALKSGEYAKGVGSLCRVELQEYCCLGVLAAEMVPELFKPALGESRAAVINANDPFDYDESYLPDDLATLWDMSRDEQHALAGINDREQTFDKVIEYIENNL